MDAQQGKESLPDRMRGKDFLLKGGERTLAISKKRKDELVSQYVAWVNQSQALFVTEYLGMSMKQVDELRAKVRDAGGEFHIIKNTLGEVALKQAGLSLPPKLLEGSSAVVFAFRDVPVMAKVMKDYARTSEFVKVKGGYLEKKSISAAEVMALADLPPLPVLRAQLLGTIMAPASKLVRTLAEPARQLAAVIKAYADKDAATSAA
jgi:large subunit ribosomal protein L10